MKIIAGLGNPGREYQNTPHNVGFDVIDRLSRDIRAELKKSPRFQGMVGSGNYRGDRVMLLQPQTFMNRSGLAVAALMRYYKVPSAGLVVVYDDADLSPGRLRIRPGGSSGGHRGIASIEEQLGSSVFARVRIGIGRGAGSGSLVSHVLGGFRETDRPYVMRAVEVAAEAALCAIAEGVDRAMNRYNGWSAQSEEEERQTERSTESESAGVKP